MIGSLCPSRVLRHSPVSALHTRSVRSYEPLTGRPSGSTDTQPIVPLCPLRVPRHSPASVSHMRSVLSLEPLTIRPSGSTDTQLIHLLCPSSVPRHSPVFASHTRRVLSQEPLTIRPSGSTHTQSTESVCPSERKASLPINVPLVLPGSRNRCTAFSFLPIYRVKLIPRMSMPEKSGSKGLLMRSLSSSCRYVAVVFLLQPGFAYCCKLRFSSQSLFAVFSSISSAVLSSAKCGTVRRHASGSVSGAASAIPARYAPARQSRKVWCMKAYSSSAPLLLSFSSSSLRFGAVKIPTSSSTRACQSASGKHFLSCPLCVLTDLRWFGRAFRSIERTASSMSSSASSIPISNLFSSDIL